MKYKQVFQMLDSIHADPLSRDLAVSIIKEAQEMYSLESRCFLESTGIYHIPLLCFLRDKSYHY